jgi:hypothetical protein
MLVKLMMMMRKTSKTRKKKKKKKRQLVSGRKCMRFVEAGLAGGVPCLLLLWWVWLQSQ